MTKEPGVMTREGFETTEPNRSDRRREAVLSRADSPKIVETRHPVSEVYGPVCQGEGTLIGKPTVFIRLGGCDYRCSWCDSLYAVLPKYRSEWAKLTPSQIVDQVLNCYPAGAHSRHVTLSGGNPVIHNLTELIQLLHSHAIRVAIETQGSLAADWLPLVDDLTLSPKPPSSGNVTDYGIGTPLESILVDALVNYYHPRRATCLKVVAFDDADYAYAKAVHLYYPSVPFVLQAGTDVGKSTRDDLCDALSALQTKVLADPDMQDVAVLPQLHAVLKGHARGI